VPTCATGPKVTWTASVLPEYLWWRQQADRRRVNGPLSARRSRLFFNRLTLEATAGREQVLQVITPEVPVLTSGRTDRAEALAEVEVTHAVFAFTSFATTQQVNLVNTETGPARPGSGSAESQGAPGAGRAAVAAAPGFFPRRWGVEGSRIDFETHRPCRVPTAAPRPCCRILFHGHNLGFRRRGW